MARRQRKLSLRKTLFILPNLFTLGSVFCAFNSMLLASQAQTPWDFWAAAWMIGFAGILDGADGRVARLTKTQSEFGLQLDSLADAVAFGVAPAWLFYHWGLAELGLGGLFVAFAYAAAAMIRLARFNVVSSGDDHDPRYFVGLPTPGAAAIPVLCVAIHASFLGNFGVEESGQPLVVAMILLFALLMVSNIKFASFKTMRKSKRNAVIILSIIGAMAYIGTLTSLEVGMISGFAGYVAFHLAAAAVSLEKRIRTGRATLADELPLGLIDDEDDEEDEEPLAHV